MATNDRLECVLENLYKAALRDVAWVSTAALINDALQTTGHGVVDGDPLPRREPRRAMADANALGASLADMLENRHSGIIQLDRRGRILEANDEARKLLLKREGLRDEKGVSGRRGPGRERGATALAVGGVAPLRSSRCRGLDKDISQESSIAVGP